MNNIWIFVGLHGERNASFPSGAFSSFETADGWIRENKLSGTLTEYPIDVGVYDWAIANGRFKPKRPDQASPEFVQRFTTASQQHYHYENGRTGQEGD